MQQRNAKMRCYEMRTYQKSTRCLVMNSRHRVQ